MSKLFEPFEAKGLTFKNRIVHVPTTMNMSDPQGYATRRLAAVYGSLARGGYSATIVGATCVRRDGLINERMLGLYDEDYVSSFSIQEGLKSGANTELLFGRNEGGAINFHKSVAHYVQAYRDDKAAGRV